MNKFFTGLQAQSCGFTLDVFNGPNGIKLIQWVWSSPVSANKNRAVLDLLKHVEGLNLSPADASGLDVGVSNGLEKVSECPFQPEICKGDHFLATGSGLA
jgi:hypothetical protein